MKGKTTGHTRGRHLGKRTVLYVFFSSTRTCTNIILVNGRWPIRLLFPGAAWDRTWLGLTKQRTWQDKQEVAKYEDFYFNHMGSFVSSHHRAYYYLRGPKDLDILGHRIHLVLSFFDAPIETHTLLHSIWYPFMCQWKVDREYWLPFVPLTQEWGQIPFRDMPWISKIYILFWYSSRFIDNIWDMGLSPTRTPLILHCSSPYINIQKSLKGPLWLLLSLLTSSRL